MIQYKINGERLKKLMNDKNIKAYKLSEELGDMGFSISTNTIANYIKGKTPPKNLEYVKAIADYFNVSTDFLLGIAPMPTNNIEIKDICNKYGLTESSLSALELANNRNKHFNMQEINTINYLLNDLSINKQNSIIESITEFLYYANKNKTKDKISIQATINGTYTEYSISKEFLLKEILFEDIKDKLNNIKLELEKEGENNEHKGNRKK